MIEAYIYTSCTSCRKTVEQLQGSGAAYTSRDYFRDRFTREELERLLERAGMSPRDVLSKRSKVYRARAEEIDAMDDTALLALMLEEPTLLRRPIVLGDDGVVIGHNSGKLAAMIAREGTP